LHEMNEDLKVSLWERYVEVEVFGEFL
jgi:hypothetical protein